MITDRKELNRFLKTETGNTSYLLKLVRQKYAHVFIHALRHMEMHYNRYKAERHKQKKILSFLFSKHGVSYILWHTIWMHWSVKTGITIPKNTCAEGLTLYHYGAIVVNSACRIGRNCCIMNNVNIGANGGSPKAPQLGNNVYIGPGSVIYGDITIADGCYIGANAVVNKSFLEPNSIIAGVPAKVIAYDKVCWWEKNKLHRIK